MKSKHATLARPGARRPAVTRRPPVPNPFPLATRRLAKRLLQFAELPEPERTRAYNAWLNSAGSPKRNADRQNRVREFYSLMKAIAKKLSPRDRASTRALGKAILAKAARSPRSQRPTAPLGGKRVASPQTGATAVGASSRSADRRRRSAALTRTPQKPSTKPSTTE